MSSQPQILPCCLRGFSWSGTPSGHEISTIPGTETPHNAYVTGSNPKRAILIIHDLFGWTFPNIRLLADHYASEADATVYVPDFFGGLVVPTQLLLEERWAEIDLEGFRRTNSREIREPEIFGWAAALKAKYGKLGAVGFCYGGWAVLRLGAKEHEEAGGRGKLVDCIALGHPSMMIEKDVDEVSVNVPVQVLAPEIDVTFTKEFKAYTFGKLQENGVVFEWHHFPGVAHAAFVRGDEKKGKEREAMVRAKDAAVQWMRQWLGE